MFRFLNALLNDGFLVFLLQSWPTDTCSQRVDTARGVSEEGASEHINSDKERENEIRRSEIDERERETERE